MPACGAQRISDLLAGKPIHKSRSRKTLHDTVHAQSHHWILLKTFTSGVCCAMTSDHLPAIDCARLVRGLSSWMPMK
jgi:hypothetical protein